MRAGNRMQVNKKEFKKDFLSGKISYDELKEKYGLNGHQYLKVKNMLGLSRKPYKNKIEII